MKSQVVLLLVLFDLRKRRVELGSTLHFRNSMRVLSITPLLCNIHQFVTPDKV